MRARELRLSPTGADGFYAAATETLRAASEFRIDLAHHPGGRSCRCKRRNGQFLIDSEGESGAVFGEEGMTGAAGRACCANARRYPGEKSPATAGPFHHEAGDDALRASSGFDAGRILTRFEFGDRRGAAAGCR